MRHLVIVGNSGSGKSTLAKQLAAQLELTHIELDALFHQPDWTTSPPAEFQANLGKAMARGDRASAAGSRVGITKQQAGRFTTRQLTQSCGSTCRDG